jgi:hypothetical protein
MVVLSFSIPEHKPMLLDGRKDQTIRLYTPKRYSQIWLATNLEIYWKLRMPKALGGSQKLFDAKRIDIFPLYLYGPKDFDKKHMWPWHARYDGKPIRSMTMGEMLELIHRDGFADREALYRTLRTLHDESDMDKLFFATRFARKVA